MTHDKRVEIASRISMGEGLQDILREPGMPTIEQCKADNEFAALYRTAKDLYRNSLESHYAYAG